MIKRDIWSCVKFSFLPLSCLDGQTPEDALLVRHHRGEQGEGVPSQEINRSWKLNTIFTLQITLLVAIFAVSRGLVMLVSRFSVLLFSLSAFDLALPFKGVNIVEAPNSELEYRLNQYFPLSIIALCRYVSSIKNIYRWRINIKNILGISKRSLAIAFQYYRVGQRWVDTFSNLNISATLSLRNLKLLYNMLITYTYYVRKIQLSILKQLEIINALVLEVKKWLRGSALIPYVKKNGKNAILPFLMVFPSYFHHFWGYLASKPRELKL